MPGITLISDLGLKGASVAIAKGVLLQHVPFLAIVDISHEVAAFNRDQAAYLLGSASRNFEAGTTHIVLFDLFGSTPARVVVSEHAGQYFISADNGVVTMALGSLPRRSWTGPELNGADTFAGWLQAAAHIVAQLQDKSPDEMGLAEYSLKAGKMNVPRVAGNLAECDVIHIDHYENVVTNMTRGHFDSLRKDGGFRLQFMVAEEITELSDHYQDVREGFRLCRFNGNGHLEICVNKGNAASLFGLQIGSRHNDIKIYFE